MEYWHLKVGEEIFIFTDKRFVCRSNRDVAFIGVKIGFRVRWECIVVCIPIFYGDVIRLHMIDYTKLLQKSEMRKVIVIELSYKGFS